MFIIVILLSEREVDTYTPDVINRFSTTKRYDRLFSGPLMYLPLTYSDQRNQLGNRLDGKVCGRVVIDNNSTTLIIILVLSICGYFLSP